jgi:hypothetical protein
VDDEEDDDGCRSRAHLGTLTDGDPCIRYPGGAYHSQGARKNERPLNPRAAPSLSGSLPRSALESRRGRSRHEVVAQNSRLFSARMRRPWIRHGRLLSRRKQLHQ